MFVWFVLIRFWSEIKFPDNIFRIGVCLMVFLIITFDVVLFVSERGSVWTVRFAGF